VSSRQRISARDYKHGGGRRGGFDVRSHTQFFIGLGVGLAVALAVFIVDRRDKPVENAVALKAPVKKEAATADAPEDPVEDYDYYDVLPRYELVLPEERNVRPDQPLVPITKAASYMIQAGSFDNETAALRRKQALEKLGIESAVQRVAIDADVRHRVRIGPVNDLARLNRIRGQLHTADIAFLISEIPK
jgi:cell division protein FtsN